MAPLSYLNFDLNFEVNPDGYLVRVTDSPAGQAVAPFVFPFEPLEFENFLLRLGQRSSGTRRVDSPEMELSKQFGGRLFDALFDDDVRAALRSSIAESERRGAGLRIRMRFGGAPELADVPWEYLYDSGANRFLSLSRETPLVRYLDLTRPVEPLRVDTPLRVLVMISDPTDYARLDVEAEWQRLNSTLAPLQSQGLVEVTRLDQATLLELQRLLRSRQFHIFHYIGHGVFDERADDGFLVLEEENGRGRLVGGQYVGTLLADHRTLRLAVLNSCEGGRASRHDPFSGAAQSLIQQGLPAVVAMQFEISDDAAVTFAQEFYMALAAGYSVDGALAEGRRAIFATKTNAEWGIPVLFMRAADGRIFDVRAAGPLRPGPTPIPTPASQPTPPRVDPAPAPADSAAATGQRKLKMLGGIVLGALIVMALLFYANIRNTTEKAQPTPLVAPVIESFFADQSEVTPGEEVLLTWSIRGDVTSVSLSGGPARAASTFTTTGELLIPLERSTTFVLTARNYDQTTSSRVEVTVLSPAPTPTTPSAGLPPGTAERYAVTVRLTSIRIIDDCDSAVTGLGEFWLEAKVNDERLRWPTQGTNQVDSGQSYLIDRAVTVEVRPGDRLEVTAAGFEQDETQTESMGSIRAIYDERTFWGQGTDSQTSLAVCNFVLNYEIAAAAVADTTSGAAEPESQAEPQSQSEPQPQSQLLETPGLQTVHIRNGNALARGFFVRDNYLVAFVSDADVPVEVTWSGPEGTKTYAASVLAQSKNIAILQISDFDAQIEPVAIRLSTSLQVGDAVSRYASATDITPGTVRAVGETRQVGLDSAGNSVSFSALITSNISPEGDAGAPVIDADGRVVGVVYGRSATETIVFPIEAIRLLLPDIF